MTASAKQPRLVHLFTFFIAIVSIAAAVTGCAVAREGEDTGPNTATGGSGGATDGSGAMTSGACDEDCSLIAAPSCFVAVCNEGMYPGPIGSCVVVAANDGTACDDGLFCTVNDACIEGTCMGGPQNTCGLGYEPCQDIVCDESSQQCDHAPTTEGTSCTPTELCKVNGQCTNGICVGVEKDCFFAPVSECNVAVCEESTGNCVGTVDATKNGDTCVQSGDPCMVDKTCDNGSCVGGNPKDCSAMTIGCQNGVCDPANGNCIGEMVPAGGMCLDATDQCNTGICDAQSMCNPVPISDGTGCNDYNSCTTADQCTSGSCGGSPVQNCTTYFEDNFEGGCPPSGWTLQADWACGTPSSGPNAALSGQNVVATVLAGPYANSATWATTTAQTPPIQLSTSTEPTLSFWAWVSTEGFSFDGFNVKVSTDGGTTFSVLTAVTPPYELTVDSQAAWGGDKSADGYVNYSADLSGFVGQQIIVQFGFRSDASVQDLGVYIDDVVVAEAAAIPLTIQTSMLPDGFVNEAYTANLTKTGGSTGSVWSIVGGNNHSWLSIDSMTGSLSGTPAIGNLGQVDVTIRVEEPTEPTNFDEVMLSFQVLQAIYAESFEGACPNGWTLGTDWECGVPSVVGPGTAFDGTQCIATQIDAFYTNGVTFGTGVAHSPSIDLTTATNPELQFYTYIHTEGSIYDGFNVKISTDGGTTFTLVTTVTPAYPLTIGTGSEPAWGGDQTANGWQLYTADLTSYVGNSVILRFAFESDSIINDPGVYIDRVVVVD